MLECSVHGCRFTFYPCGHVPYGREAVAPVGLDGMALTMPAANAASLEEDRCTPWQQTRFAAVLDAARGKAWPRDGPGPCWTTQLGRINELATLLGLEPALPAALGERLARLLDLPRLMLIDDTNRLAQAHGFREHGAILADTLARAASGRCVLERVLACGSLVGLWRPVHFWRATPGGPQSTVFPGRGAPSG